MLLRTRVITMVTASCLLLAGGLYYAGLMRERIVVARYAAVILDGTRTLLDQSVAHLVERLRWRADRTGDLSIRLAASVAKGDRAGVQRLGQLLAADLAGLGGQNRVEVQDADGTILFTTLAATFPEPMMDDITRIQGLQAGTAISGIENDSRHGAMATLLLPLAGPDGAMVGSLTLATNIAQVLPLFKHGDVADAFIEDTDGKLEAGTNQALWDELTAHGGLAARAAFETRTIGDRTVMLATIPLQDRAGQMVGRLLAVTDATKGYEIEKLTEQIVLMLAAVTLLALLWLLNASMRRAFTPLEEAIDVLNALARGNTAIRFERPAGNDEVGRIVRTVGFFRETLEALSAARERRERQRQRQEQFIRQEMTALAGMLAEGAKAELLNDLAEIEAEANRQPPAGTGAEAADGGGDALGMMAPAFRKMSLRVREQHQKLSLLVAELRDALMTKTQFISLQQELEIARKLQASILPSAPLLHAGTQVAGAMVPAKEVGGDFYDYFPLPDGRLGVAVADVSGKGVPAAFFMAISRTLLRATAGFTHSPSRCVAQVNDLLAAENPELMFVTLFYGILDPATGRFDYCNAGHNQPLLVRGDGTVAVLPGTGDTALAVVEDMEYHDGQLFLSPGDTLFLFTDGVTEAFDVDEQLFGDPRLIAGAPAIATLANSAVPGHMVALVNEFARGAPQADDITCVSLRYATVPA
ncbi:SpoIIE family protein phosphatase [Niveispirillum sp. KHB5.9]|uniref:SpoIIE family protein phosphatase n=1 Tax=Niveispirillum sp. KHB5.9 TaxID=3400269 RepID=UPI003A888DBB